MTKDSNASDKKALDFESGMKRLQEVVEALEGQELTLEEAVSLFEEGMELSKRCAQILDKAEKRIKLLIKDQETGEIEEQEFEDQEEINP